MEILKYNQYIKEAKMDFTFDEPRKSILLFSDIIRQDKVNGTNKFEILHYIYDYPDNEFIGLRIINPDKIHGNIRSYRFTFLKPTIYIDTNLIGRNQLSYAYVELILNNSQDYYFYELVRGNRINGIPDRNNIIEVMNSVDGKQWFFIIEKNKNCSLIKTLSRQEGGTAMESELSNKYGWEHSPQKIILQIRKNNNVIESKKLLTSILSSDDSDIFSVDDNLETFTKYDLIIDGDKKIEIKKIDSESEIWKKRGEPKSFMLAEQCKVSDVRTLKKVVEWYRDIFSFNKKLKEYKYSSLLASKHELMIKDEFSKEEDSIFIETCDDIRDYYNGRLDKLLVAFSRIENNRWMNGTYGIYFAIKNTSRRFDFLIKTGNNIKYEWKIVNEWKGFKRLKLFMNISGESSVYILTDNNNFIETYKLKDYEKYKHQKIDGVINIKEDTYVFNERLSLWQQQ